MVKDINMRCGIVSNGANFVHNGEGVFAPRNEFLSFALSKSTKENIKRTKMVLTEHSRHYGTSYPEQVSINSSFCNKLSREVLKIWSKLFTERFLMGTIVQLFRYVYECNSTTSNWNVNVTYGTATRTPLIYNRNMFIFRKAPEYI